MAINIKFDLMGNPEPPSIILANRSGNKLGQLNVNVESIDVDDKFNDISEFSFTLNKYIDDELVPLWDKVVDFKLVYCPEWDMWFEIKVELDEATETVKTVFCAQLGQAELSQIMLYNIEINTDVDIEREDFKTSILYDEKNPKSSILHRILEKAPHYSIAYVDESIQRIQRQFSFNDTSICDAFNEIAEEIGCLFVYNSNSTNDGKPNRVISVYDLQQNCNNKSCKHRGEFADKCPKCGGTNITYGFGGDTTIFVTADELATEGIQLVTDTDAVKNCFKLEAGDDLMTATIRNCNPNGSDYIWYFSDSVKEDMSDDLVAKIESYDTLYKNYYDTYESTLDATLLSQYNALVEKYKEYYNTPSTCLDCDTKGNFEEQCSNPECNSKNILTGKSLQTISTPIIGYPALMNAYYNTIDLALYLKSGLMPSIQMSDTSAAEQVALLTAASLSPVAVENISNASRATANSAVLSMAKTIVKSTYKVEIENPDTTDWIDNGNATKTWKGKFIVTNYSDKEDTATSAQSISVTVNGDIESFIQQKIDKALNKVDTDDYSISGLFKKNVVVTGSGSTKTFSGEFYDELKKYALNPLTTFYDACEECISILIAQRVAEDTESDLYINLYTPYYNKLAAIEFEIKVRENEINLITGVYDDKGALQTSGLQTGIESCKSQIQNALNFEKYLGENLWLEFCTYRREDKYSNSNYISDGLNNAELFEKANEFIRVAEEEIFKSAELQHSISATLNNLLALPKFEGFVRHFKTGNWIRVQIDDRVFKLRLLEYKFNYGDLKNISVEFSDVTKIKNGTTDVQDIFSQASSMASSYDTVQRQAHQGDVARGTIDQWFVDGLSAANVQIQSNDNEEILLTKNGLLARSYDDITGTYSPEQLKITHNIMAYTDDNWKTVRQAIGKQNYKIYDENEESFVENTGYGMNADFVNAGIVSGSQIIGGDIYSDNYSKTNNSGSYLNLRDGTFDFGGGKITFNGTELLINPDNDVGFTESDITRITNNLISTAEINAGQITTGQLSAERINTAGLIAENISATTIEGKTIKSSDFKGGYLLIGDETKVGDYAEIASDGKLTCTNIDIKGGSLLIGDEDKIEDYAEITSNGTLTCTNIDIKGGALTIGSENDGETHTWIDTDGTLNTCNANITGQIHVSDNSTIAGFAINGDKIYKSTLGSNDSIFLSTTNMNGVSNFFDGTEINNWRLTVGNNFGVTSEGRLYAKGANITGAMNISDGSTIAGWNITADNIVKKDSGDNPIVGLHSGNDFFDISLVNRSNTSPIRFYAGESGVGFDRKTTFTHTSNGEAFTQTITLSEAEQAVCKVIDAQCLTTNKVHSDKKKIEISYAVDEWNGVDNFEKTIEIEVCPSWVPTSAVTFTYKHINGVRPIQMTYNEGKLTFHSRVGSRSTTEGTLTFYYNFIETLDINLDYNDTSITVVFNPQTIDVAYSVDIQYRLLDLKGRNFMVLEDGSLYACNAHVNGTVYATDGEFNGTVYATDGEFSGTVYATDGEFSGTIHASVGDIGGLNITESGLSSNAGSYYLNQSGLTLNNDEAKIRAGHLSIYYSQDDKTAHIMTTDAVKIQGENGTSIELMTDTNGQTGKPFEATLFGRCQPFSPYVDLWLEVESEELIYSRSIVVNYAQLDIVLSSERIVAEGELLFEIAAGAKVSNVIALDMVGDYLKFQKQDEEGSWTELIESTDLEDIDPNEKNYIAVIAEFTQTQSNNNIKITGNLIPAVSSSEGGGNGYNLGSDSPEAFWNTVYARTPTIQSSDRNKKNTIQLLSDTHTQIFDALKPVSYKFNVSNNNRTHIGLIAQDVKEAVENAGLTTQDFAGYCEWENSDGSIGCGLRYGEFISLCIYEIQKLKKRVKELEGK